MSVLAVLVSGCSWTFVQRAPRRAWPGEWIPCQTGLTYPVIDAALAVLYPVGALARVAAGPIERTDEQGNVTVEDPPPLAFLVPATLAGAAVFGWSAWSGYRDVRHCRDVQQTYWQNDPQQAPSSAPGGVP